MADPRGRSRQLSLFFQDSSFLPLFLPNGLFYRTARLFSVRAYHNTKDLCSSEQLEKLPCGPRNMSALVLGLVSYSSALFCTRGNSQLLCFHEIAHSLAKTPGWRVPNLPSWPAAEKVHGNFSLGQRVCPPCLPSPTEAFDVKNVSLGVAACRTCPGSRSAAPCETGFHCERAQCEPAIFNADAAAGPVITRLNYLVLQET